MMAAAVADIGGFRIAITLSVVLNLVLPQVLHVVVLRRDYFIDERKLDRILTGSRTGGQIFRTEQLLFRFWTLLSLDGLSV